MKDALRERLNKYPHISSEIVEGLYREDQLHVLDQPWCAVMTTEENEWNAHGYSTKEDVIKAVENYGLSDGEGGWSIECILHDQKPVQYQIKTTIIFE